MANALAQNPIIIDTDLADFRGAASVLALGGGQGIRVTKLALSVGSGSVSSAGQVVITAPSDSITLYPPVPVSAGQAAYTILYVDGPDIYTNSLTWRNFAVTGVTATKTVLYLWWRV